MAIGLAFRNILRPTFQRWRYLSHHRAVRSAAVQEHKYNGYSIKKEADIPELNLRAILLEHRTTGAEHLHLACQDSNNLFGVAFRTPPSDSCGVCHILEHLALCGSKRFPCRDPFFNMLNRSLSTFMNAFTGSDMTIYAFSTQNPKDFQNLLSVYLDATFSPLLNEKDFRQEGWRLEHEDINDKNSPIVFKGVVYNEMKGVFSDPNNFYARHLQNLLYPGSAYSHESGGDPFCIPQLTWEGLKQFHSTLYHPSNSRFITYGNMPLEQHLEQIEAQVLEHCEGKKVDSEVSLVNRWATPKEVTIYNRFNPMSAVPEKQTIISNSYILDKITNSHENFTLSLLGTLMVDGPNAPFYKSLLESGIGPDYSPCTGFDSSLKESMFSVGLREIAENDIGQVKDIIESTFDNIVNNGFPEDQIKGVLHRVELATKHRTSNFGLNCALGVSSVWNHGGDPINAFRVNDHVQHFLGQLKNNKHILQDKVMQYFKNNSHKLTLIMKPVEGFEAQLQEREKELLSSKLDRLTDADRLKIHEQGLELAEHQKNVDASCLPTLRVDDVRRDIERTPLTHTSIDGVSVQLCEQPTNELLYFRAKLDASQVPEADVPLLPLFAAIITQMGAGSRNYQQFDQEVQLKSGGFDVSLQVLEDPSDPTQFQQSLLVSSHCLEKNVNDMFSLWKDIFTDVHLKDVERLTQLIRMGAAEMAQGISGRGHLYAMRKACSSLSPWAERKERTAGLSQIEYMKKLAEMDNHSQLLEKLQKLSKSLIHKSSMKCALNGTTSSLKAGIRGLEMFLNKVQPEATQIKVVSPSPPRAEKIHFILPLSVNYLGQSVLTVPYTHPHFASLKVAAKLLSSKFLHSEIREKGGAYGGGATVSKGGHFMFYSYRDPNVSRTLQSFSSSVSWLLDATFSDQDIEEAKLGIFGEVDAPVPPGSKGQLVFQEGISDDMKEQLRANIFSCTREDLVQAACRYLKDSPLTGTALIGPENKFTQSENDGWIIMENKL